jgi:hypothetical protein
MKKKTIFIIFSIMCFIIVAIGIAKFLPNYNEINEFGKKVSGIQDIEHNESMYKKNPSIELAFSLMDKYKHVISIKDNKKVEFYGKAAIHLGADDMLCGFWVNLWLASVYNENGDKHNACIFFKKATKLQNAEKHNIVNEELLQQEGLGISFAKTCQGQEDM